VGICLCASARVRLEGNTLTEAGFYGIEITRRGGSQVVRNVANDNGNDGIHVFPLELEQAPVTLARNRASHNGDLGIEVDVASDAVDGGGNRAFGNGNPLQCLNVVCK
jgi:parallel beta-helix repeat protein